MKQTTTSALRRAACTSAAISAGSAAAVPGLRRGRTKARRVDVRVAEERDLQPARLDDRRPVRERLVRARADRLDPRRADVVQRVQQRTGAEVVGMIVREREHVEAGDAGHRRQRLRRAAEVVLLAARDAARAHRRLEVAGGHVGRAKRPRHAGPRIRTAVRGDGRADLFPEGDVAHRVEDDRPHDDDAGGRGAAHAGDAKPVAARLGRAKAKHEAAARPARRTSEHTARGRLEPQPLVRAREPSYPAARAGCKPAGHG